MTRTLDHLFDRNVVWAQAKTASDPGYFRRMAEQQTPHYVWIGCSDSRVTANDVLGLDPGEVFVHRNIANVVHTADLNLLSVLEYAVEQLRVEHIIVCGHYGCGGVQRAVGPERGAMLDHWLQPITMFYRKHKTVLDALDAPTRLNRLCEINVEMQVRRIAQTPIIEKAWLRGQIVNIHGWIYAIDDGLLRDLGCHVASLEQRDALPQIDQCVALRPEPISALRRQAMAAFCVPEEAPTASVPGDPRSTVVCC